MSLQTVCRLCLSLNTPVRALDDGPLRDVYEKLTDISLITPHRPLVACLLCYGQLKRCHNLMVRSVRADKVLSHILDRGEVVTEASIAMINWKAYQLKDQLSLTPIKLIAIPSSGHNLMEATIKEEPVQSQFKEEVDMDRCLENLKCEESEEEECVDRAALRKITEDMESGVLIDEQDVKSEELEGAMNIDNEGWASEQNIDTVVLEDLTMDIEKLTHEADRKHDILYEAENVKGEDMMQEVSEAAEYIESSESEGAAPAVKCKRTHTKTQDRTPGEQNITEKRRKQRTVEETESPNTNTDVSENTEEAHLNSHLKIHTKEKPFECEICHRAFTRKFSLNLHLRIHTKEKPFKCAICQQAFTQKSQLNNHLKVHTKEKPFQCAICQRRFTFKFDLKKHLRIHTKEKPFECLICQRRFNRKSYLNSHLRIHTKEKPFKCAICQRAFTQKSQLNNHLKIHTKERPFECAICQRRFAHKGDVNRHLKIHTKEKPFECPICQRRFSRKSHLNSHLRIHTKEKPFECAICQRTFAQKATLNSHLRIHTKEKPFEFAKCRGRFSEKGMGETFQNTH